MDKTQAQLFRQRWQIVERTQSQEMRAVTPELRQRQLNAIYRLARSLRLALPEPDETRGVERWARLRESAGRSNKV